MSRLLPLSALILLACCQFAFGQDAKSQPVARLITSIAPVTRVSVPPAIVEPNDIGDIVRQAVREELAPYGIGRMARIHSESMSRQGYFSHVTPEGLRLRDRAKVVGILHYVVLGENIAYNQGYDDPGAFAVERWMASEKHRANILSPEYKAMAIGSFVAPDGSIYLTQTFITR